MSLPKPYAEMNETTLDEFIEFLQGKKAPAGYNINNMPNLNIKQAWNVIYVIQEWLGLIPDNFELCCKCNTVFVMGNGGDYTGDDAAAVQENIDAGYKIDLGDVGLFLCGGCM